jgi:hypothetical protein
MRWVTVNIYLYALITLALCHKITIITGTGRSGTSFLMGLFTKVGMPTGFVGKESTINNSFDELDYFIHSGEPAFEHNFASLLRMTPEDCVRENRLIWKSPFLYIPTCSLRF